MKIIDVTFLKSSSDTVLARADVHFEGFILKGFKVLKDNKSNKNYVTPPSYRAGVYWRPLFRTDSPEDWKTISERILKEYEESLIKEFIKESNMS